MDKNEFERWMHNTLASEEKWVVDRVQLANGRFIAYKGGVNGSYLQMDRLVDGVKVSLGLYEGAIPHIAEASFTRVCSDTFKTSTLAKEWIMKQVSMDFSTLLK